MSDQTKPDSLAKDSVGLIGVGAMGAIIARHLSRAGWRVVAWDRKQEAVAAARTGGIVEAATIAEVAECPVVISIVFDDAATREIVYGPDGLLQTMGPDSVHVVMASITPALSRELSEEHGRHGQLYLAASMFGRPEAAEAVQLLVNCSGPAVAFARAEPLLQQLGSVRWVGEEPEKAMLVKAMGNSMITAAGQLIREMFGFLEAGGIDKALSRELLIDTLFPGPIFEGGAARHISDPGLPRMTAIARKDRDNCLAAASALGVELPLLQFLASRDLP